MKTWTKRDLVVLDVVRAGYARSQENFRRNGGEKDELHGIVIERYYNSTHGRPIAFAYVKSRVGRENEEEVICLELVDGRWKPRYVDHYDGTLRIDVSLEGDRIVFGEARFQP